MAFSRGPRACLGINLAWAELRLGFAHVYRKFDLEPAHALYVKNSLDPTFTVLTSPRQDKLMFRETFLPYYYDAKLKVNMRPASL